MIVKHMTEKIITNVKLSMDYEIEQPAPQVGIYMIIMKQWDGFM